MATSEQVREQNLGPADLIVVISEGGETSSVIAQNMSLATKPMSISGSTQKGLELIKGLLAALATQDNVFQRMHETHHGDAE